MLMFLTPSAQLEKQPLLFRSRLPCSDLSSVCSFLRNHVTSFELIDFCPSLKQRDLDAAFTQQCKVIINSFDSQLLGFRPRL